MFHNLVKNKFGFIFALSALVYFGQGIEGLPSTAFFFYLKETLGFNESKIMFLSSLIALAWLIKPVIGYLIDTSHWTKRTWILISLVTSGVIASLLGYSVFTIQAIIFLMMLGNWNAAVRDVAVDGIMCIEGKKHQITGRIQSIQWIAITIASVLVGVGGGFIAEHFDYRMGYLLLLPFYFIIGTFAFGYKETTAEKRNTESFITTLKHLFTDKNLLIVALFIFLYKFAPSFGTPLTFIMRDEFQWSKLWIGTLGTISAGVSIIGAMLYFHFSKYLDIKKALVWSVYLGALTTLCYLYFTPVTAVAYEVAFSLIGMFIQLMLLDFMARNTKPGMEATSFALLCSVSNFTSTCDGVVGGILFPHVGLTGLILISAGASFLCLPLIKRLKT
jgi:MFS family permease